MTTTRIDANLLLAAARAQAAHVKSMDWEYMSDDHLDYMQSASELLADLWGAVHDDDNLHRFRTILQRIHNDYYACDGVAPFFDEWTD